VAGKFLIDVTDPRFFIPDNDDVLGFIRRANPFAHSDVGTVLFDLGKQIGASAYCPSVKSCAYVVLHTAANRIFAIAYGQRGLAFRFIGDTYAAALAGGGAAAPAVGREWVAFDPWAARSSNGSPDLSHWARRSYANMVESAG
jgi:hypothetical protein